MYMQTNGNFSFKITNYTPQSGDNGYQRMRIMATYTHTHMTWRGSAHAHAIHTPAFGMIQERDP